MPKNLAAGDAVQIQSRDVLPADIKSQLYFDHYKGLAGTVTKIYPDDSAVVTIDPESLPADIAKRHHDGSESLRLDWLGKLSDEARNRLSATEKRFNLRYTVLVGVSDLVPVKGGAPAKPVEKAAASVVESSQPRKSLADIEAEEARHLAEIASTGDTQ
jgi:hypothetical protein